MTEAARTPHDPARETAVGTAAGDLFSKFDPLIAERQALLDTQQFCATAPLCRIVFRIPGAGEEGRFVIRPRSELPPVQGFAGGLAGFLAQIKFEVRPVAADLRQQRWQQERRDGRDNAHSQVAVEWLALGAVVGLFGLLLRAGWVTEDAYITLRPVDNWVNGFGLRWNPAERVQGYTHPLWMVLLERIGQPLFRLFPLRARDSVQQHLGIHGR